MSIATKVIALSRLSHTNVLPSFFSTRRPGLLGPVGRRPIIAKPKLKFNPGSFFFFSKAFYWIISSFLFRASNHQIVDKQNKTEFSLSSHI